MTLLAKDGALQRLRRATPPVLTGASLAVLLCGCQTPVKSADLAGFSQATTAISKQAATSLADSNTLARQISIERFVQSGEVGLTESQFPVAVASQDVAAWQQALDSLEQYGNGVSVLTDTSQDAAIGDGLVKLGQQARAAKIGGRISPQAAAGFASLGDAIAQAASQHQARDILKTTDPAIQQITSTLADAIGATDEEGLRGTVKSNWIASSGAVRIAYAKAATQRDAPTQRTLIGEYLGDLDRRDAQLKALASLRASLLGLGAAHAAAAAGRSASIPDLLTAIVARAEETQRLYAAFSTPAAAGGQP